MLMGVNAEIIGNSPFYKFNFIMGVISGILVMASNYFLIHKFGMNGAALSTLLNISIVNIARYYYINHKINMHPFSKETLKVALIGLLTFVIIYLIPNIELTMYGAYVNIALRSLIIVFVFIGSVYYFKISEDFNNIIRKGLRTIRIK